MFQLDDNTHKLLRGNDISIGGLIQGPQIQIPGHQISIGGLKKSGIFTEETIFHSEDKRSINFSERIKLRSEHKRPINFSEQIIFQSETREIARVGA